MGASRKCSRHFFTPTALGFAHATRWALGRRMMMVPPTEGTAASRSRSRSRSGSPPAPSPDADTTDAPDPPALVPDPLAFTYAADAGLLIDGDVVYDALTLASDEIQRLERLAGFAERLDRSSPASLPHARLLRVRGGGGKYWKSSRRR